MDAETRKASEDGRAQRSRAGPRLRALTFLAPGIPRAFFELVTGALERALGCAVELDTDGGTSGPMQGDPDPFGEGRADIGFLCSPSYLYLRAQARPSVELVPAAFAFRDPRAAGEPVYFSDVVVLAEHAALEFGELAGGAWGYNDECSLSGYFAALQRLSELGCGGDFFGRRVRTGSHQASVAAVLAGDVDSAAIDSTTLALMLREQPGLRARLRVLESFGPFPIQPVVVRSELGAGWAARIAAALLALHHDADLARRLARFGLERCVPIDDTAYAQERRALRDLGQLPA
jgi:ABC-type phosphate/phosphonate transport system substrate-binding protein